MKNSASCSKTLLGISEHFQFIIDYFPQSELAVVHFKRRQVLQAFCLFVVIFFQLRPRSSLFRVRNDGFLLHKSYPFTLLRFLHKNGGKISLVMRSNYLITNTEPKIFVFLRSHCSGFEKLIIGYWNIFKKLRFLCVHIDQMRFLRLLFCRYPLLITLSKSSVLWRFCADQCEHFHKNGCFSLRFCTKTEQCERALNKNTVENSKLRSATRKMKPLPAPTFEVQLLHYKIS